MNANERRKTAAVEAAEWLVCLREDVSVLAREKFVDWLRESPLHVAEMLRVQKVHHALAELGISTEITGDRLSEDPVVVRLPLRDNPVEEEGEDHRELAGSGAGAGRRRWPILAIAAVILATVIATVALLDRGAQTIQTARGERREISLADGSVVQIDPQTRLRIKFDAGARQVVLERGRAVFHVAKNPSRPFTVQADGTVVRAVGTAFGVEQRNDEIVVTVAEGKVAVHPTDQPSSPRQPREGGASLPTNSPGSSMQGQRATEILLVAGEQVKVQHSGPAEAVRKVDAGRQLAWAEGRLIFDHQTLADVIEQFNRYSRVQLHVYDEGLASLRVTGVFNASGPEDFVAFMQATNAVRVVRNQGEDITLAPPAD